MRFTIAESEANSVKDAAAQHLIINCHLLSASLLGLMTRWQVFHAELQKQHQVFECQLCKTVGLTETKISCTDEEPKVRERSSLCSY